MKSFWKNKRVFITGHTGFKGAWLSFWLKEMGAHVRGFSLPPQIQQKLFTSLQLATKIEHIEGDLRDAQALKSCLTSFAPDIVLHLAAQAIVARSYREPLETYSTNVMGTLHLLEALRQSETTRAAVIVTTDKCYENRAWPWPYRELDSLGGADMYSSSKACAEILTASFARSFLTNSCRVATARAGNVVGGGDFSEARLIPDILLAAQHKTPLSLRHPQATRPWQHVLDPLRGYLTLAEYLFSSRDSGSSWRDGWNFGPSAAHEHSVMDLVMAAQDYFPNLEWKLEETSSFAEAQTLALDSSKARQQLGWQCQWDFQQTMMTTFRWYQGWVAGQPAEELTLRDLQEYERSVLQSASTAQKKGIKKTDGSPL